MNDLSVQYTDNEGNSVKLTKDEVVKYISTDPSISEKEVFTFIGMCKYLKLNPFLKEVYLIKYKGMPATFVVSYQTLLKRAEKNENFDGYDVTVEGEVPDLTATAIVYRKDKSHPFKAVVHYKETVKTTIDRKTGKERPMSAWARMPRWMLRKVALARALKEAFPNAVGSLPVDTKENVNIEKPMSKEELREGLNALYGEGGEEIIKSPAQTESIPS
jgi:phage recombination protein Bet